jgi:signal transduction histidine kinase
MLQESLNRLQSEVEELRASRERLVRAAYADRRRFEHELHDGLQQHLVGLAVNLQRACQLVDSEPDEAKTLLEDVRHDVHVALDEARKVALRIYPPLLGPNDLRVALRTAGGAGGFSTDVQVAGGIRYPTEITAAVYFCCLAILEQLGTVARSAVTVRAEAGEITFEIAQVDSGSTVAAADLALERERLEALGGHLAVSTVAGGGIRVRGSLPASSWS